MEDKRVIIEMALQHLDWALLERVSEPAEMVKDIEQAIQLLRKIQL